MTGPKGERPERGAVELLASVVDRALAPEPHEALGAVWDNPSSFSRADVHSSVKVSEYCYVVAGSSPGANGPPPSPPRIAYLDWYGSGDVAGVGRTAQAAPAPPGAAPWTPALPSGAPGFDPTAFFAPQVATDEGGAATVEFTAPSVPHLWTLQVVAVAKDGSTGSAEAVVRTAK